ncbi:hypothetical protein PCANC_27338 [Puccinia coronata f. sp. avenae]|uniref:Uncharacterized protein n=1 Tax=Puccinia coronata f. sp. avenae TaxID=200324 RepID=A0A2N5THQ6_9BASI|nr:hypothetical protein PCANC_27338 [Puccinia coronata f. sp. avenae]
MLLAAQRLEPTGAKAQKPVGAQRAAHGGLHHLAALMGRADFKKFTKTGVRTRPKPARVWVACWTPGPITILT